MALADHLGTEQDGGCARPEDGNERPEFGLIAEEVENIEKRFVFYNDTENGLEIEGVHYKKMIPVLINEIQNLNDRIKVLENV